MTFVMPNIWDVPVFTGNDTQKNLLSVSDIEQTIVRYLRDTVNRYNTILARQNDRSLDRYNAYT